ncbi:MAG: amidohydrolase family protein [Verrucomicrobiales bacterium]
MNFEWPWLAMFGNLVAWCNMAITMKRRSFLQSSSRAMIAAAAVPHLSAGAESRRKIVDTHQHLWDPDRINPPWLQTAPEIIRSRHHLKEYQAATAGYDVSAVYMEIDVAPADLDREAAEVIALCRDPSVPTLAATIGGRPDAADFPAYVERHSASGFVRGVRQVLHGPSTPTGHCLRPEFIKGVRYLGSKGLHFDLCLRPGELLDGAKLASECPETRFVVDHCGNADVKAFHPALQVGEKPEHSVDHWKSGIDALAGKANTICKISGIIARLPEKAAPGLLAPIVNHCLDAFGPERVVFGGDWPVCLLGGTWRQWVEGLAEIIQTRPEAEREALWRGNALKFYKLPSAP